MENYLITFQIHSEKSEMQIKRALQEMTNWNLSALYSMNNLQIIKTDVCNKDKTLLRKYIERFTSKESEVSDIMSGYRFNAIMTNKILQKNKHN